MNELADAPMPTQVCIFEDSQYRRLLPLVYFRPVYNLKCGLLSLREKIERSFPRVPLAIQCRDYLADYMRLRLPHLRVNELSAQPCLFINGRVIAGRDFASVIRLRGTGDVVYMAGNDVVAARVSGERLAALASRLGGTLGPEDFDGLPQVEVTARLIHYPWDIIGYNGEEIVADAHRLGRSRGRGTVMRGAILVNRREISIGRESVINPGAVIDATDGPVIIGRRVTVMSQAVIKGPAAIGDESVIKVGAKIYHETTIGPVCKAGGEIEASIIHGYANKQHDGFLGHSYVGAWVNLGAGTTNSDLKNNYGTVKVVVDGVNVDSGKQFVGLTIGDHSKTAINSVFNTGTVIGVSSNVFGSGFPPKFVPSFSWGAAGETLTTYNIDRAIEAAQRVMARRHVVLSTFEQQLFRTIFELTRPERLERGLPA